MANTDNPKQDSTKREKGKVYEPDFKPSDGGSDLGVGPGFGSGATPANKKLDLRNLR